MGFVLKQTYYRQWSPIWAREASQDRGWKLVGCEEMLSELKFIQLYKLRTMIQALMSRLNVGVRFLL